MAAAPLAVCTGAIHPQPPGTVLPHCADQVTPPGGTSFVTVALTEACATDVIADGGCCLNETDGGCATMVIRAIPGLDGVVEGEEAVIVTTPPTAQRLVRCRRSARRSLYEQEID